MYKNQTFAVPPSPPALLATSSSQSSVQLQWKMGETGGAPVRGYLLSYKKEFADWEEITLDRRSNSHVLEGLQCGTKYQFTLAGNFTFFQLIILVLKQY